MISVPCVTLEWSTKAIFGECENLIKTLYTKEETFPAKNMERLGFSCFSPSNKITKCFNYAESPPFKHETSHFTHFYFSIHRRDASSPLGPIRIKGRQLECAYTLISSLILTQCSFHHAPLFLPLFFASSDRGRQLQSIGGLAWRP